MGGIKSADCNDMAQQIWVWYMERGIWLCACYIPGSTNVDAGKSRIQPSDRLCTQKCLRYVSKNIEMHFHELARILFLCFSTFQCQSGLLQKTEQDQATGVLLITI